jgi:hypothetical protein
MTIKKSRIYFNKTTRSADSGKELLELWLDLGTMEKARVAFNASHVGEDYIGFAGAASRRLRYWLCRNTDVGLKMIQDASPELTNDEIYEKIVFYATREFQNPDKFREWVEKYPWAKKFKKDYDLWYKTEI